MPTRAFILIETQVGRANQVVEALRSLPGVMNADVIVLIEVDSMGAMADLVTGQMQSIRGVLRTITCVVAG